MKPASRQIFFLACLFTALVVGIFLIFRRVYEPELTLRVQLRRAVPDAVELERLLHLATNDRFDLTDTLRLANIFKRQGRVDDELALYKRLKIRYPTPPAIRLWYADRLHRYGRWAEADAEYTALLDLLQRQVPPDPQAASGFWRARYRDIALARHVDDIADRLAPLSLDDLFRKMGENAMAAGAATTGAHRQVWFEKSQDFFERSLKHNPNNQNTRGAYANLLLQNGRPAESLRQYEKLLETDPDNPGWLVSAALTAGADHQFGLAERHIRRALAIENLPEWRLELARFMSWGGKHEAALDELSMLVEQFPDDLAYRRERATFLQNAQRHREYIDETERLVAAYPLDLDLRVNRIRAMINLKSYSEAIHEASALLAMDPGNREVAILKAQALLWMGDFRAAQAEWKALAIRDPEDRMIRKRLAQSFLWDKRYNEALTIFRTLNPSALDDPEIAQGYVEAVAGHPPPTPEDVALINALCQDITNRPDDPWPVPLLTALGRVLRAMGDKDAAVSLFRAAILRAESNLKLRLELADLLQDIGRREEADREYRHITNLEPSDPSP